MNRSHPMDCEQTEAKLAQLEVSSRLLAHEHASIKHLLSILLLAQIG